MPEPACQVSGMFMPTRSFPGQRPQVSLHLGEGHEQPSSHQAPGWAWLGLKPGRLVHQPQVSLPAMSVQFFMPTFSCHASRPVKPTCSHAHLKSQVSQLADSPTKFWKNGKPPQHACLSLLAKSQELSCPPEASLGRCMKSAQGVVGGRCSPHLSRPQGGHGSS